MVYRSFVVHQRTDKSGKDQIGHDLSVNHHADNRRI